MRVLVVEDDRSLGAFLKNGMEMEGHRVEWVEDGEAALIRAAENPPDLILLDLSLPKRDGTEVLTELRRATMTPRCWYLPAVSIFRCACSAWIWAPMTACSSRSATLN